MQFAGAKYLQMVGLDPNSGQGHYSCSYAVSDYARKLRVLEGAFAKIEDAYNPNQNTMKFEAGAFFLEWGYQGEKMKIHGRSPRQKIDLSLVDKTGVLWHKDKMGIHGLIAESSPDEPSFYYSIPALEVEGMLAYTGDDGRQITTKVTGQGWCDRQWGDYLTKSWEWCSMRFLDGDRVNLYAFPQTGHKVGSYMTKEGKTEYFDNFTVRQKSYFEAPDGSWLTCEWDYDLPIKGKKYHVTSASKEDVMISPSNTLLEGMGFIRNEKGEVVGYTANESMDIRATKTGPYKNKI